MVLHYDMGMLYIALYDAMENAVESWMQWTS